MIYLKYQQKTSDSRTLLVLRQNEYRPWTKVIPLWGNPHCFQGGIHGKLGIAKPMVEPRAKGGAATTAPVGQEFMQNWRLNLPN